MVQDRALQHLRTMLGEKADFREGQWEAIEAIINRKHILLVQRTGWGKSIVYFIATKLLREEGKGPTLVISPLISLMRDQVRMAERMGICARTINSENRKEWESIEASLKNNSCDMLLISPERLNNKQFINTILPIIGRRIGLFVVDEAHCISDWGHDFRPDYRRIVNILRNLPRNISVLATTATANNRVIEDIKAQLGEDLLVFRGTLARESLRLQVIKHLDTQSKRLAWLAENLPKFGDKSGIIYCLTVSDVEKVTAWLKSKGFLAEAYHAGYNQENKRSELEQKFLNNQIKILVATVALGMGFDKPDIGYVIHFQHPGSVVTYYQQIGRAGRVLDRAYAILLSGAEDEEIQDYFIQSAFPSVSIMQDIITALDKSKELSREEILKLVNVSESNLDKALKLLEVDGAIAINRLKGKNIYYRTPNLWTPNEEQVKRITEQRCFEQLQMQNYINHTGCLMEFLQRALEDPEPRPCGRCANCKGKGFPNTVSPEIEREAEIYLKSLSIPIKPRQKIPPGLFEVVPIQPNKEGRALCYYGDQGLGKLVCDGKYKYNYFSDELVEASVHLICELWKPNPFPCWVTAIPSRSRPNLVPDFAKRLADKLGIPYRHVLARIRDTKPQKEMQNSYMQAYNVKNTLDVTGDVLKKPVLLVDDIVDSGWTLTVAGILLYSRGCSIVYPFTLAKATPRYL